MTRDDEGSSLILIVFAAAITVAVTFAVFSATSLYLERKRLLSLADGAALAGAESYDLAHVSIRSGVATVTLDSGQVRRTVQGFVAAGTPVDLGAVRIDEARTRDGRSATVTLSTVWHPPVVSFLMPTGMRIDVTSTARSVFSAG